jgi:hypothetical protein
MPILAVGQVVAWAREKVAGAEVPERIDTA